jgi:hypothetical protein
MNDSIHTWWLVSINLDFFSSYWVEQQKQLLLLFKEQAVSFFQKDVVLKTTTYPFIQDIF